MGPALTLTLALSQWERGPEVLTRLSGYCPPLRLPFPLPLPSCSGSLLLETLGA